MMKAKWDGKKILELLGKNKYVLAVLLVGAVLLLIPTGNSEKTKKKEIETSTTQEITAPAFSLEELENKMQETLSEINGAGKVKVVLTLKSGVEKQLAQDEKTSLKESEGKETYEMESSVSTVIISAGSGVQDTITKKYIYPEFLGALVVCEGADNAEIRLKVTQSVAALTGLGSDKISVIK